MSQHGELRKRRTKRRLDQAGTSRSHPPPPPSSSSSPSPSPQADEREPWPRDDKIPIATFETFTDPKAAVKSHKCTHRALTNTRDDYDSQFYIAWLDVSIEPTRFIDQATVRRLGIELDLSDMIRQLGFGSMATRPYDLHVSLIRQFMATVQLTYNNPRTRVAGDGILSFFARVIRYRISITDLCDIYGFTDSAATRSLIPDFLGLPEFWGILGTGYFMRALANTMLCKMEHNKVMIQELTLLYGAVNA
ncbi:hypothetical protein Bca4012_083864 [Brassica carinata]